MNMMENPIARHPVSLMSRGFSSYLPECNCYLTAINCTNTIEELIWVADWNSKEKSKNVTQDISNDCRIVKSFSWFRLNVNI
jgi:hypothetical protein